MSEWKKHDGGPMPCHPNTIVVIRCRDGAEQAFFARQCRWQLGLQKYNGDVMEYRIVEAPREPVKTQAFMRWRNEKLYGYYFSREDAIENAIPSDLIETITFSDGEPNSTFERVK